MDNRRGLLVRADPAHGRGGCAEVHLRSERGEWGSRHTSFIVYFPPLGGSIPPAAATLLYS